MNKAHLYFDESYSIKEVQEKFSLLFPFLKIDFSRNGHDGKKLRPQKAIYPPAEKLKDIMAHFGDRLLELDDSVTVAELEFQLRNQFGLCAQFSRKCGTHWLEITLTNHWTLRQQNARASEISPFPENK